MDAENELQQQLASLAARVYHQEQQTMTDNKPDGKPAHHHEHHHPTHPDAKNFATNQSTGPGMHHPRSADDAALKSRSANEAIGPDSTETGADPNVSPASATSTNPLGDQVGTQSAPVNTNAGANPEDPSPAPGERVPPVRNAVAPEPPPQPDTTNPDEPVTGRPL